MSAPNSAVPVSLNHHKQEVKRLLAAVLSGEPPAIERIASARSKLVRKDSFILADAQSVIAREVGSDSWRKLKEPLEPERPALAVLSSLNTHHAQLIGVHLAWTLNASVSCRLVSVRESTYVAYLETVPPDVALYIFNLEPMGGRATLD
jgi:hypothetical protein